MALDPDAANSDDRTVAHASARQHPDYRSRKKAIAAPAAASAIAYVALRKCARRRRRGPAGANAVVRAAPGRDDRRDSDVAEAEAPRDDRLNAKGVVRLARAMGGCVCPGAAASARPATRPSDHGCSSPPTCPAECCHSPSAGTSRGLRPGFGSAWLSVALVVWASISAPLLTGGAQLRERRRGDTAWNDNPVDDPRRPACQHPRAAHGLEQPVAWTSSRCSMRESAPLDADRPIARSIGAYSRAADLSASSPPGSRGLQATAASSSENRAFSAFALPRWPSQLCAPRIRERR